MLALTNPPHQWTPLSCLPFPLLVQTPPPRQTRCPQSLYPTMSATARISFLPPGRIRCKSVGQCLASTPPHTRKSSSPIPTHMKMHIPVDTKHTTPPQPSRIPSTRLPAHVCGQTDCSRSIFVSFVVYPIITTRHSFLLHLHAGVIFHCLDQAALGDAVLPV